MIKQIPCTLNLWLLPIILFFLITLLPLLPIFSYDYHNHQRIWQITLLISVNVLIFYIACFSPKPIKLTIDKKTLTYFLCFLLLGLFSALFNKEFLFSLMYTGHFFLLVGLLLYANQLQNKFNTLLFIYFLVASHISLLLICLLNIIFSISDGVDISVYIVYSGFINIRFFNQVQLFILPLLLLLIRIPNVRKIMIFMIGFNVYLLFLGHGRGAPFVWFITLLFIYLTNNNYKKQAQLALFVSIVAWLIFITLDLYTQSNAAVYKTTSGGRIDMWLSIIDQLKFSHVFLGVGPGIYEYSFPARGPLSHPHSSIFELLNEWGGIATLLFSYLVFSTIRKVYKHIKQHNKDIITAAIFYSWLSGGMYSLVSGVLVMPVPQTLFFILWGLILSRINPPLLLPTVESKLLKFLLLISFFIFIVFFIYHAYYFYSLINPDNGYTHGPRFWSVGKRI